MTRLVLTIATILGSHPEWKNPSLRKHANNPA